MGRLAKQLFIGSIFLIIVGTLGYGAYDFLTPDPTCDDGKQNQGEEGVDCGTVCGVLCGAEIVPLGIGEPSVISDAGGLDIVVELENTNTIHGAFRVDWTLTASTSSSEVQIFRRGNAYVNPLETRYLVVTFPNATEDDLIGVPQFEAQNIRWFTGQLPERSVVDFSVLNERLTTNEDGSVSLTADVRNDSTFAFDEVDVTAFLLDASGVRIGVGATIIRTLVAGQVRAFTIDWPFDVPGDAVRAQIEVTTNVFDNANFIRTYGGQEQFQQF